MSVGKIGQFDVEKDNWDSYVDRLGQYFVANDVKPAVQVATLITVIGGDAYDLMVNLCTPVKPSEKTYNELVEIMKGHLQPKPSVLAERFKFRQRNQRNEESVAEYAAELKKLTKDCKFNLTSLTENLRDQFVCGIASEGIRQRLFTEEDITFERAFKIAVSMEAAETHAALVEDRTKRGDGWPSSVTSAHQLSTAGRDKRRPKPATTCGPGRDVTHNIRHSAPYGTSSAGGAGRNDEASFKRNSYGTQHNVTRCVACGGKHEPSSCKFKVYVCRICNRQGHLKKMCPNLTGSTPFHTVVEEQVGRDTESDGSNSDEVNNFSMDNKNFKKFKPYIVNLIVDKTNLPMEIDTGSAISCINSECYRQHFSRCKVLESDLSLRYYTGEIVKPVGKITISVGYEGRQKVLDLYIVDKGKTSLVGRQWLTELNIKLPFVSCNNVSSLKHDFNFNDFSSKYKEVFADGLGRFTGGTVGFRLREGARPVFLRARPLAYALREPVERALDQLVRDGVITPVTTSDWATPIVPVMKKDGTIRVCADFKLTLNKYLEVDRFPLPRVDDLLAKLHGGERFTKLDLSQAYLQFELDESKRYAVINTHKGLFMYNRLIFGLASSPGIFQRKLEQLFADLPRVGVFLDDLIITGTDNESHLETLHEVFRRLKNYGLRIRKDKCVFFAESVTYLGFMISKEGVHTCPEKIEAIKQAPEPKSVSELRSFLGLVMYYAKFVRNISSILSPLYNLLRKGVKFVWDQQCQEAFKKVKQILVSSEVLAHYSLELPVVLTADASSVGVGAVVSHLTPDGERPVAYASRTLTSAEKGYSQIEREALGIIFGIRKFHQYLYGRKFVLRTDHKPLVSIFGEKKGIPVMAASRLQRWAVLLSGYNFDIEYVRGEKNAADALSRLPVQEPDKKVRELTYLNFIQNFLPVDRRMVQDCMVKDEILRKVVLYIQSGWPATNKEECLQPFYVRRHELYLDRGCIVWGYRLVIPTALREVLLKELHVGHMGIVKMKCMARSTMWWPGIDAEIERACRSCSTCAADSAAPPRAPPQPWPYISEPWTRLHVDFLGPFHGKTFLVIIDATSKWLEVFQMQRTTAEAVIKVLRETFARFGLPKEVVSDNGPPFSSKEYNEFMTRNGVKVSFSAVYHPASNGAAEGAVKLCKRAVRKALRDGCDVDAALQTYLFTYRNVTHSTTGVSPATLLQRRTLRSRLDLLKGDRQLEEKVKECQGRQVEYSGGIMRNFNAGEEVWYRNYTGNQKWISGTILQKNGSRSYSIASESGPPVNRHVDQIKKRWTSVYEGPSQGTTSIPVDTPESTGGIRFSVFDPVGPERSSSQVDPGASVARSVPPVEASTSRVNPPGPTLRPRDKLVPPKRFGFEID